MTAIIPRSGWNAAAPKSRTPLAPSRLAGVTLHWFGKPRAATTHAGCPALLRSVQRGHMAPGGLGAPKGGADIGYNHAVCPHGAVYELRGFGVQTGANGTETGNESHAAIVYMAGTGDPLTEQGKRGLNFLIEQWRTRGAGPEVSPHSRWTGSECPGPDLHAWLTAGRPINEEVEIVEAWVPEFVDWYLFDRKDATRPKTAPKAIPQRVWDLVKLAERYRAEKPDSGDAAELRAKIEAARKALA